REKLLALARFKSTTADGLTSLADYVERMKDGQEAIYYITGEDIEAVAKSPQLEGFRARGIEVLLLVDPVDEFWLPAVGAYGDTPFRSVTQGGADLDKIEADDDTTDDKGEKPAEADAEGMGELLALLKMTLGEEVKDVRPSDRLTDSAVCLVADEGDLDMNLQRLLKQHGQLDQTFPRILEINPGHELIRGLAEAAKEKGAADTLADAAHLLLDQARILEGEPLPDPPGHAKRMAAVMAKGFGS
ncbi:MAG: molecular chaperone HtpG, partial [Alphaproteobacteria bacterium]|nr:molecular chaperone HtpG [Alphaproteobacteria bacterium]